MNTQNPQACSSFPATIHNIKMVLLGDMAVGKTSIALRFTRGTFEANYKQTIGGKIGSPLKYFCISKSLFPILHNVIPDKERENFNVNEPVHEISNNVAF